MRRDEGWDSDIEDTGPAQQPIGVPGAMTPQQMTGQKPSFAPAGSVPTPAVREGEMDMGVELSGYGLCDSYLLYRVILSLSNFRFFFLRQGVKVTTDEITDLVKLLGLDDEDSKDLISGLDFTAPKLEMDPKPVAKPEAKETAPPPPTPVTPPQRVIPTLVVETEATTTEPESVNEETDDDSELDEPLPLHARKITRKRTDERPLQSPLKPSGNSLSQILEAEGTAAPASKKEPEAASSIV